MELAREAELARIGPADWNRPSPARDEGAVEDNRERASAVADYEVQDDDFHAFSLSIKFEIENTASTYGNPCSKEDPDCWYLSDNEAENAAFVTSIKPQIVRALMPWVSHYHALGLPRDDEVGGDLDGPGFYLICSAKDRLAAASLLAFPEARIKLDEIPGAILVVTADANPISASQVYRNMQSELRLGPWGGDLTPSLAPRVDEGRGEWLARLTMPDGAIERTAERWEVSGRDLEVFRAYGDTSEREMGDCEIAWLVEGRIPRREITLLAGNSAAGKSSLIQAWMAALGGQEVSRPREILEHKISGRFVAALISGEDDNGIINFRAARHAKLWGDAKYIVFTDMTKGLDHYLAKLWAMPVLDLVVLDPVRAFFTGNEKDAVDVNAFLSKFLLLARAKNCAVILVHHITKGSARDLGECRSLAELKGRVRGSGAFIELPRMVIGAVRRKDGTVEVGPVKYNLPPENVWLAMGQGRRYWPNPDTFTLDPISNDPEEKAQECSSEHTHERVAAAIERCNRTGSIVRRSGKTGLFESKLPELGGLSRSAILDAIGGLLDRGEITNGEAGLLCAPALR